MERGKDVTVAFLDPEGKNAAGEEDRQRAKKVAIGVLECHRFFDFLKG